MANTHRDIGTVGTGIRVVIGLGLLILAGGASITSWAIEWHDAAIGLAALPALMLGVGLAARRYAAEPLRWNGPLGITINCAVIVALFANGVTSEGAALFYGSTLLVAALRGQAGCEATVMSNWVLGRDDQIGCPCLTPIDDAESAVRRRQAAVAQREGQGSRFERWT